MSLILKIGYIDENGVVSLVTEPQTNFHYGTLLKVNGHLRVVTIEVRGYDILKLYLYISERYDVI